jgi:hypothetical protein
MIKGDKGDGVNRDELNILRSTEKPGDEETRGLVPKFFQVFTSPSFYPPGFPPFPMPDDCSQIQTKAKCPQI